MKTHVIKRNGLKYHDFADELTKHCHVEGVNKFLEIKAKGDLKMAYVIEDRFVWNIDPSHLIECTLYYITELDMNSAELIFKEKISEIKMEGNYKKLWQIV